MPKSRNICIRWVNKLWKFHIDSHPIPFQNQDMNESKKKIRASKFLLRRNFLLEPIYCTIAKTGTVAWRFPLDDDATCCKGLWRILLTILKMLIWICKSQHSDAKSGSKKKNSHAKSSLLTLPSAGDPFCCWWCWWTFHILKLPFSVLCAESGRDSSSLHEVHLIMQSS